MTGVSFEVLDLATIDASKIAFLHGITVGNHPDAGNTPPSVAAIIDMEAN